MAISRTTLGGFEFVTNQGGQSPTGEVSTDITRRGVPGHAIKLEGKRGNMFTRSGMSNHASAAPAEAAIDNYFGMKGSLQTLVEASGQSRTNIMVKDVQCTRPEFKATVSGGMNSDGPWRVDVSFTLHETEV